MSKRNYGYSRANFLGRLAEGDKTEKHVAEQLIKAGIKAVKPECPEGMPTSYYTKNQIDLIANDKVLEIKGRRLRFDGVESYPYDTLFIESQSGFNAKIRTPDYYVNVSNPTGAIIALDVASTRDTWFVESVTDRQRGITYPMYIAKTEAWINFDEFVERLKA